MKKIEKEIVVRDQDISPVTRLAGRGWTPICVRPGKGGSEVWIMQKDVTGFEAGPSEIKTR